MRSLVVVFIANLDSEQRSFRWFLTGMINATTERLRSVSGEIMALFRNLKFDVLMMD